MELVADALAFITLEQFITCKRKNLLDFDLLIDDGPHNLIPAVESGRKVICIPHPWNKKHREQYGFPQMSSWKDAKLYIDEMLQPSGLHI